VRERGPHRPPLHRPEASAAAVTAFVGGIAIGSALAGTIVETASWRTCVRRMSIGRGSGSACQPKHRKSRIAKRSPLGSASDHGGSKGMR
jgi:hypothetical protein